MLARLSVTSAVEVEVDERISLALVASPLLDCIDIVGTIWCVSRRLTT